MSKPDATKTDKSAAGKPAAGGARGQHKMMGEVTKIDSAKGMVTLKTDEGDLDLHFPPSALQGIKEGDRVEVQMAIRPAGAAGAGSKPAAGKAPATKTDDATKGSGKAPTSTGAPQQPKTQ
jgi:Cu/Ag efflux protein CusF